MIFETFAWYMHRKCIKIFISTTKKKTFKDAYGFQPSHCGKEKKTI